MGIAVVPADTEEGKNHQALGANFDQTFIKPFGKLLNGKTISRVLM